VLGAGDAALFSSLESSLVQALPQDPSEWRRSYGRAVKSVHVEASFISFGKDVLPKQGDWHLIQQPIFHIFWTECMVCMVLFIVLLVKLITFVFHYLFY
jgi:hypothetical protein